MIGVMNWNRTGRKLFLVSVVFLVIFLSACSSNSNLNLSSPHIELSTDSFDLGDINPDEGIRTETFYIKNTGEDTLIISSVSTSCGCTEAEVNSYEILSGKQTELVVTYDPSVHPGLVGKIKRIIYIQSNDPDNEEAELELVGNSLPSSQQRLDGNAEKQEQLAEHNEKHEGLLKDFEISPADLYKKTKEEGPFKLLDVREDSEYDKNHLKGSLLLSVNKINQDELDKLGLKKDDEIILYCRSGKRSERAYRILKDLGYSNVKSLYGGILHWIEDEYPVEEGFVEGSQEEIS